MKRIPHPDATSSPANKMLKHAKTKAILHGLLRLKAEIQNPSSAWRIAGLNLKPMGAEFAAMAAAMGDLQDDAEREPLLCGTRTLHF